MRRLLLVLFVALTLLGGGPAHAAEDLTSLTNADRRANGLPGVVTAGDLQQFAQRRAEEMARSGKLAHTANLGAKIRDWERLGENVGRGPHLKDIERSFMASETHRRNILFRTFSEVGAGVASDGRLLYVVVVFRGAEAKLAPAPVTAPAPAPAPKKSAAPGRRPAAVATTSTAPGPPPAPPVEVAPEVTLPAEPATIVEPAPGADAPIADSSPVVEAPPTTAAPGPVLGPLSPTGDILEVAAPTKSFRGRESAARPSRPHSATVLLVLLSAVAVGAGGLTTLRRRARRARRPLRPVEALEATAPVAVVAPPSRPVSRPPTGNPKPTGKPKSAAGRPSRVGRHTSGSKRSKSKRKRR